MEKLAHDKNLNEIEDEIRDIKLKTFIVNNPETSKFITKAFGFETEILSKQMLPFFYNEGLDIALETKMHTNDAVLKYFRQLKRIIELAFDMPAVLEELEDFIHVLDRPAGNTEKEILASMKLLPRYKKLQRLKQFYATLVRFTLRCIHNYFWNDITKGVEKGAGVKNPQFYIKKLIPMISAMKKGFEAEIEREFPSDKYDKEFGKFKVHVT